jgi:hypothetical protein
MLLAAVSNLVEWGLLAVVLVCTAIVVSRAFSGVGGKPAEADDETGQVETMAMRRVANLEVRLHDFSREVEARLEKRAVELNALVAAADQEIVRLSDLLKSSAASGAPHGAEAPRPAATAGTKSNLSGAQEQMICHLHDAGFSIPEIAHMIGGSADAVSSALRAA